MPKRNIVRRDAPFLQISPMHTQGPVPEPNEEQRARISARRRQFIPTTTTPSVYGLSDAPFRLFGFALETDFLDEYCKKHNIGGGQPNASIRAVYKIMLDADVEFKSSVKTVYTGSFDDSSVSALKPKYATCLVLANNKPAVIGYSLDEDMIKRVQEALGVDAAPMWYKQF